MNNEKLIWDKLKSVGFNECATAGIMGNLFAESGCRPDNLQNTFEKRLGMTDAEYTAAVDNGTYDNFVHDSAGYGLAQWTFWSRKQGLINYCKERGTSIGDLNMQLDFLCNELKGYSGMMRVLEQAASVREASDAVLTQYERPADQSEAVKLKRATYGLMFYERYASATPTGPVTPTPEPTPTPALKSTEEMALEVIRGDWGNGAERKRRLEAAGYNYSEIQARVNEHYATPTPEPTPTPALKSTEEMALEVIRGDWGNGAERKRRLEAAGYNYSEIQARVDEHYKQ